MSSDRCDGANNNTQEILDDLAQNKTEDVQRKLGAAYLQMRPEQFKAVIDSMERCAPNVAVTKDAGGRVKAELKDGFLDIPSLDVELGGMRTTLIDTDEYKPAQIKPFFLADRGYINRTIGAVAETIDTNERR